MNNYVFFLYLLILAGSTYLIRVIPFVAIKNKINNRFIRSFLAYIPYAVLTAMTIPAVFYATNWWAGAAAGLIVAVIFALKEKGLTVVAIAACVA
ncbi:MAG: AzlD domain-containing protein, partial [Agathobacter sp.]|nr:AzlD domain-containing protein [Lachnospiraceae bacterium]MDY2620012.1 AzlD domain-containing protein [Agathobacter sp.]